MCLIWCIVSLPDSHYPWFLRMTHLATTHPSIFHPYLYFSRCGIFFNLSSCNPNECLQLQTQNDCCKLHIQYPRLTPQSRMKSLLSLISCKFPPSQRPRVRRFLKILGCPSHHPQFIPLWTFRSWIRTMWFWGRTVQSNRGTPAWRLRLTLFLSLDQTLGSPSLLSTLHMAP